MQRLPLVLILGALILGGAAYWKRDLLMSYYHRWAPAAIGGQPSAADAPESDDLPPPGQRFSKLPPPAVSGEKQYAPPGTFYVLKRKRVTSKDGVKAVNPGEQVKLLERLPNKRVRVTIENADFVLPASEVTDDLDVAREAERQYLNLPPPGL